MIYIWAFPADWIYREQLNPAERVNDIRHPINLQLFNWRVPAPARSTDGQKGKIVIFPLCVLLSADQLQDWKSIYILFSPEVV